MALENLPQHEIVFEPLGELGDAEPSRAWRVVASDRPHVDAGNAQLLDAVAEALRFYPRTLLQVHVVPPHATHLPRQLARALRLPPDEAISPGEGVDGAEVVQEDAHDGADDDFHHGAHDGAEVVQEELTRLARRRAEAIVSALILRHVPAQRLVGTAPNADLGMPSSGMFTVHPLPDAVKVEEHEGTNAYEGGSRDTSEAGLQEVTPGMGRAMSTRTDDEALMLLRQRREAARDNARTELEELHAYAGRLPALALAGGPVTFIVSVHEVRLQLVSLSATTGLPAEPLVAIAFGTERVDERVAAFEAGDLAIDELDLEIWEIWEASHAYHAVSPPMASRLIGATTVSVAELLTGEQREIAAVLPVLDVTTGSVVGDVRFAIQTRGVVS